MTKAIDYTKAINSLNIIQTNVLDAANIVTLKDGKQSIAKTAGLALEFEKVAFDLNSLVFDGFAKIEKTRTKKAFVDECKSLYSFLKKEIQRAITLQAEARDKEKEESEAPKKPSLKVLANSIKKDLDKAQSTFLRVGKSLTIALDTFKEEKKKQADFLAWANDSCGIKKAQVYKLMKVYKEFGDDSDFSGVSMRVLYTLTGQSQLVIDKAKESALDGTLTSSTLDEIIMEVTAPPTPPTPPETPELTTLMEAYNKNRVAVLYSKKGTIALDGKPGISIVKAIEEMKRILSIEAPETPENDEIPESDSNTPPEPQKPIESAPVEPETEEQSEKDAEIERLKRALENSNKEQAALKAKNVSLLAGTDTAETPKSDAESEVVKELKETITELRETVQTLQTELTDARENKRESVQVKVLPYLPQFDSKCFSTRLGLDLEDATNKAKINKSYRILAKIYTVSASKQASEALKEAREELLKNAK